MDPIRRLLKFLRPEAIPSLCAPIYDRAAKDFAPVFYKGFIEAAAARHPARVLDIGTGPGYVPIGIAKLYNTEVVGIDLSEGMIALARENAGKERLGDRLKFEVGDGKNLRFEDGSFDMVISTATLHHWRRPVKVLNEGYRVLRPGGEFRIYDFCKDASREDIARFLDFIFGHMAVGRVGRLLISFGINREIRVDAYTLEEAKELCQRSQFGTGEVEREGPFMRLVLRR